MDEIISSLRIFLGGITAAQWYVFGSLIGASGLLFSIIAYIKRREWKKHMDKFEDWIINLNLWFFSTVLTLGSFVIGVAAFGVDSSMLLPYLGDHAPQIFSGAVTLYAFSKQAKKKLAERKARKLHITDQLIDGFSDVPATPVTNVSSTLPTGKQPIPEVNVDLWQRP